jgi:hypothetical protein
MKRLVRVDIRVYDQGNDPAREDPRFVSDVQWLDVGSGGDREVADTAGLQAQRSVERLLGLKTAARDGGRA